MQIKQSQFVKEKQNVFKCNCCFAEGQQYY